MNIIAKTDLIWRTDEYDVILVGTSIYCMLSNGFQSKMRMKYPYIEDSNNGTTYADSRKLGTRLTIDGNPTISLMYICNYPNRTREYIDYDALENCLRTANAEFKNMRVATTVLGSSIFDGNGDKKRILGIMETCTPNLKLDVYDYDQIDKNIEIKIQKQRLAELKDKDYPKFQKMWAIKEEMFKKMYLG